MGSSVVVNPVAWEFIANHALAFDTEVYGWLLGYFDRKGRTCVLAPYDCQEYVQQTVVSAQPAPEEFHELAASLPPGLGVVGMYHSHPRGSIVFHSHVDDHTVGDFTKLAKGFVSIVTNGEETECFRLEDVDKGELGPVEVELDVPEVPPSTRFALDVDTWAPVDGLKDIKPTDITSFLVDAFFDGWDGRVYRDASGRVCPSRTKLSKLGRDGERVVFVELPRLSGNADKRRADAGSSGDVVKLEGRVEVDVFHAKGETIGDLEEMVKTGLLDRLNRRVLAGNLDRSGTDLGWSFGGEYRANYLGVPLYLEIPNEPGAASRAACRFLSRMRTRLGYFELGAAAKDTRVRAAFSNLANDLRVLAGEFSCGETWQELENALSELSAGG